MPADEIFLFALFYLLYNDSAMAVNWAVKLHQMFHFRSEDSSPRIVRSDLIFRGSFHSVLLECNKVPI